MPQNSEHNPYTTMSTTKIPTTEDLQHNICTIKHTTQNLQHNTYTIKHTTQNLQHNTYNENTYNSIPTAKILTTQYLHHKAFTIKPTTQYLLVSNTGSISDGVHVV